MANEAETPEFAADKMVDEGKICDQFGTVVSKASLGELQESKDGHSLPSETAENPTGAEESEVAQCFKNGTEGKVGNPESDGFSESLLVAKRASGETPIVFRDGENKSVLVLIKNLELENEMQIYEDQTNGTMEATADIIKGDNTEACGQQALTEMSLDTARVDLGLVSSSNFPTVQNHGINIGEKLPVIPVTSVSVDFSLQDGEPKDPNSSVLDDMDQKDEVPVDDKRGSIMEHLQSGNSIHQNLFENSVARASQSIDEDKAVSCTKKYDTKCNESGKDSVFKFREEEGNVNNMDVESYKQAENGTHILDAHKLHTKEEEKQLHLQEEEVECKGKSPTFMGLMKDPETIIETEDRDDKNKEMVKMATEQTRPCIFQTEEILSPDTTCSHLLIERSEKSIDSQKEGDNENAIINVNEGVGMNYEEASEQLEKEKLEMEKNDKKELASEIDHEELDFKTNDPGNSMHETPIEEVYEGPKIANESKDTQKDLKEESCTVKNFTIISNGEQGDGSIKGENEATKREGEVVGLETVDADKEGQRAIEEVVADHSTATVGEEAINDGNQEDKVIGGLEIANVDNDIQRPIIEEDGVPDHSTIIIGEEPTKYVHEENNAIGGSEFFDAEKVGRDQENVVTVCSTINIKDEDAIKDGSVEDKASGGLEVVDSNKDIGDPFIDKDVVPDHFTTTFGNEQIGNYNNKDRVIGEHIVEEDVSDQSTAKILEKLIQEIPDDEILGSEIDETDKEIRESIKEENFAPQDSITSTELIKDGHDEIDKVIEKLDTVNGDKYNGELATEDDVVSNHPTKIINDGHEEEKVNKGLEILSAFSDIRDPITEEENPENSTPTTGEEPVQQQQDEGKLIEGTDTSIPEKAIGNPVVENIVDPDDTTTIIEDEPIKASQQDNNVTEGLYVVDADKQIEEAIIDKNGVDNSTTTIEQEEIKDYHQQDKVTEELETVDAVKEFGVSVTLENVVMDHSTPPTEEARKDDNEEDKVTQGKEIIDAEISDRERKQLVVKETVNVSPTNIGENAIKDDHEEDKMIEELDAATTHKAIIDLVGDPIIEENVVSDDSTSTIKEEPTEDDQGEDKVNEGLYLVDVDKETEEPVNEENVVDNYTITTGEDAIKDDHKEDKVTEELETADAIKDIGDPSTEETVVLDHSTTSHIEVVRKDDIEEVQVTEGKEIIAAGKDIKQLDIQESVNFSPETIREKAIKGVHEEHKATDGIDTSTTNKAIEDTVSPRDSTTIINDAPGKDGKEEDKVSEGLYIVDVDKHMEEAVSEENDLMQNSTIATGEEASKDHEEEDNATEGLQTVDEINDIWAPIIDENVILDHYTTTSMEEETKDDNEKVTEGTEITEADNDITQLITKESAILPTTSVGEKAFEDDEEKGTEGLEIVDVIKAIGESFSESVSLDHSNNTFGEELIKDSQEEDKVTEGIEIVDAKNDIQQFDIDRNFVLGHPAATTEEKVIKEGHEEDKVTERLEIVEENKKLTAPIIEENVVLDHSTTTIPEEAIEDDHEKDKVNEESEILDAEENIEDLFEENVVLEHLETIIGDASKDGYMEDKVVKELEITDADKSIGQNVIEESDVQDSTNSGEDAIKDDHEEDKVNDGLEMVCADRDIGMLVTEENAAPDHSITNVEKAIKDDHEEVKVIEGLEIVDAAQESCKAAIEENAVLDHSTPIWGEASKDGHEEDKVTERLGIAYENKDSEVPIVEEDVVQDHFKTSILEKEVKDGQDEYKVTKELEIVDGDKDVGEPIVQENVAADQSTSIVKEEVIKDGHEEDKVTEVLEVVDADKIIVEPVIEENIALGHATITIGKEVTSDAQDDKVSKELDIVDADPDVGEPIIEENVVADLSKKIITEEIIKDCHEEDKVTEEFDIVEENIVLNHVTLTIGEEAIIYVQDDKVTEGSETVDAKNDNIGDPLTGETIASDQFTTIGEETRHDGHEEDKVTDGLGIVDADQDNGEPVIEENVILGHFTTTLREEAVKDDEEDKINGGSEIAVADKDVREPIEENFVLNHSTTIIGKEGMKDSHDEDTVAERLETVGTNKDIGEPKTEDNVVQDHSTTTITEENHKNDKVIEELEIDSKDKDVGEPIIKNDVGQDQLRAIVIEDAVTSDKEEEKAIKELEIAGANKEVSKAIVEDYVVPDQFTTIIKDEPINDNHEEDKVVERLKATAEGEVNEKEILEDDIVTDLYEKTIGDDTIKGIAQEYEVCADIARAEDVKQIVKNASITEVSMISVGEVTKENTQEDEMGTKERERKAKEFDLPVESNFEASNSAQKVEVIMSRDEEKLNSDDLNDIWTEKIEAVNMTNKTEMVNPEDVDDLHKSQGVDNIKEIAEEEIIYEGRREMLDETSLVPHMFEQQQNEHIIEECEEGNDKSLQNVFVKEEIKRACLHQTESEGTQLIELSDGLHTATSIAENENSTCEKEHGSIMNLKERFMQETIKTELIDHLGDHGNQNKEVVFFSDLSPLKENFKPVDLNEDNKWLTLESTDNHNDGSNTTHQLFENPANEVFDVLMNNKVQEEDGDMHDTKLSGMSKGPEPTVSNSHQVDVIDGTTTLVQASETESMKLEKTGESDSIEVSKDTDVKDNRDDTRTSKDKHSSTNFDTDAVEGDVSHERNEAKDDDIDDRATFPLTEESVGWSWTNDEKEQLNIELEPILKDEDASVVEYSTISEIQYEKVCDAPKIADQRENTEKLKEENYISEDITSVHTEDTIDVNPEEEKNDAQQLDEEVCEEAEFTMKEIRHHVSVDENSTYTFREVIASKNFPKDEKVPETPGGKVEDSDSVSKEDAAYSATQTEIVTLEEGFPKKGLDAFTALEDITKMESSTESTMSEETVIEDILEKTDSKNHENISVALLTEELSLHEAEPKSEELVDSSDHASTETFSTTIQENWASPLDPDVEDLKHKKTFNPTDDTFTVDNKNAAFEQEKPEIPVEASFIGVQSDKDTGIAPAEEITAVKASSDDRSNENPEESSTLASATRVFDKTGMKEMIKDDFLIEGDVIDKKMEASLQAQTEGEPYMQMKDHMKLNEDSEMETENTQKISVTKFDAEKPISEQKDDDLVMEGGKVVELNELSRLDILSPYFEKNEFESQEKSDAFPMEHETTSTCIDIKTDILEEEDLITGLEKNLENSKTHTKVQETLVVKATEHSHEINESYNVTEKVTLAQENLEEVDTWKVLNKATESVEHDENCQVRRTEKTDVVKDRKIIKDWNVVPVEEHTVRQNTKEEEKEYDHLEEAGPKLDAEEQNDKMKVIVMDEEMHHEVERGNKSENIENQSFEKEASKAVEATLENTPIKEVKGSDFISTDKDNEAAYSSERTETKTSACAEELNVKVYANTGLETPKEEIHKQKGSEEYEVFNAASEVYQDNVIKEIREGKSDIVDLFHIQPALVVTEGKSEDETIVEGTLPEAETSKVAETINTSTEEDNIERINLDCVSQLLTFENGSLDQQSVTVDKDVIDNVESETAINTEGSLEKDQKKAEAVLPLETTEPAELENLKNTTDHITSTHALPEETSAKEVGEACKIAVVSNAEDSDMHDEGSTTGNDIIESKDEESEKDKKGTEAIVPKEKTEPSELGNLQNTTDKITITHSMAEDTSVGKVGENCKTESDFESNMHNVGVASSHDTVSVGDGRAEAIFQEHKKGEGIDEVKSESEDYQNQKSNETKMEAGKLLEEESGVVSDEVIHEIITKTSENNENEPNDATHPEHVAGDETPPGSTTDSNTMGTMEKLQGEEELPTDNCDVPFLTNAAQVQKQEEEGQNTGDEKQEVVLVKKEENEMSLSAEESKENIEHKVPVAKVLNEGLKKINELGTGEKMCTDEEGETPHKRQTAISTDSNVPDQSSEVTTAKDISIDAEPIGRIDEKISTVTTETSSIPVDAFEKSLLEAGAEEAKHKDPQGYSSEVNKVECEMDKRTDSLDEEAKSDSISLEAEVPLLDLLHEPKTDTEQAVAQFEEEQSPPQNKEEMVNKAAPTAELKDGDKTVDEDKDEEADTEAKAGEDEEKNHDQGSDASASKDKEDVNTTPKKSHNMLSGVGSKVKHSISKVKKAITGKPSHSKQLSPK